MRPFRLLALPFLQLKRVFLFMNNCQRIKLAVCSDVAEEAIKQMSIRIDSITLHLSIGIYFIIETPSSDEYVHIYGLAEPVKKEFSAEKIDKRMLSCCYQKEDDTDMHFELSGREVKFDTSNLLKWMVDMFASAKIGWHVNYEKVGRNVIDRLCTVPFFELASRLKLRLGRVSCEQLTKLMDRMEHLEEISIEGTVPLSFNHEKALSYPSLYYGDARWLKVENLFQMKGGFNLNLGKTDFENEDFNRYLKYWKSTKDNVKGVMRLRLKRGEHIKRDVFFRDVPFLQADGGYIILCDHDTEREHALGYVYFSYHSNKLIFETEKKSTYKYPCERLILSREVKYLEDRMKEVYGQMVQCQYDEEVTDLLGIRFLYRELENSLKELGDRRTVVMRQIQQVIDAYWDSILGNR